MNIMSYDKLIRDNVPQIIENDGKMCQCKTLSDDEYIKYLDRKLNEEVKEYLEDKSIDELADVLEVVYSIAEARGYEVPQLEKIRRIKAQKNGRFLQRICLKEVISDLD